VRGLAIDVAAWSSPWRQRSPGDKLLLGCGLVACALVLPVWPAGPLVAVVAVGLAVGPAGVSWRVLAVAARGPLAFIVLGAAGIAVTWRPGPGAVAGLTVTADTLARAAATAGHGIAGTAGVFLLAVTTPISDLLGWARRRGVPEVVVDLAGLVYRLLFVLLATTRAIRAAQTARLGYATRRAALRSAAMLTATVLSRAWERARRLEEGLAGRGLDGPLRVLDDDRASSPRFVAASVTGLTALTATSVLAPALIWRVWGGS
jgi:cobalt/nickel transport system permease protein